MLELGARIKQSVEERDWEGKNFGFQQTWGQGEQRRLQQMFRCKAGSEAEGLPKGEEQKERLRFAVMFSGTLTGVNVSVLFC